LLLGDDSYSYVDIPSCQIQDEGWFDFHPSTQFFLE
jgi:hypothetical protein